MSHFALLIIGNGPEDQLAPFDESIEMPEYLSEVVSQEEKDKFTEVYTKYVEGRNYGAKSQEDAKKNSTLSFDELYSKYGEDWNAYDWRKDKDGVWGEYSTYNPASKWDWYEIGGRYAGRIIVKEGVKAASPHFSWGWSAEDSAKYSKERRTDQALVKDIENLDDISAFAVLKDGEWYERGKMGWWGMVADDTEEDEWKAKIHDLLKGLPEDTLISMYDCHI